MDAELPRKTQLTRGSQLGPYKIEELLGSGGMGEVFRAVDTRLDRKVAIKISAERFTDRFEREARAIAALNHPNVCTLYDVGPNYLVMELVEGQTLAARLSHSQLPIEQAVRFGMQIADALAEAHARGIVHRDLKPGNIMLTSKGVKVLDFGLAKMSDPFDETLTATHAVMGTPAYMSPEQLQGQPCDARSDIYSLGLVLYEMLTGKRLQIGGRPAGDDLPISLRHVVEQCLAGDRDKRWQSARDVELELKWASQAPAALVTHRSRPAASWAWAMWAALAMVGLAIAVLAMGRLRSPLVAPTSQTVRFRIPLPQDVHLSGNQNFSLSPDGRTLLYNAAGPDQIARVWAQPLDSLEARPLPGTEIIGGDPPPFWSPDSKFVIFYSGAKLKKTDLSGSPPQTICTVPGIMIGGAWNRDGVIIFGRDTGGLMRVPAGGGEAVPLTTVDRSRGERLHGFPAFLPDGRHFLYSRLSSVAENSGVYAGSLDQKPEERVTKPLIAARFGAALVPTSQGHGTILFLRDGTLWAQELDTGRLEVTGDPVRLAEHVGSQLASGFFAASAGGALVYRSIAARTTQLTWVDRLGKGGTPVGGPVHLDEQPVLSPDGTRIAMVVFESTLDIWAYDVARNVNQRLTSDPAIKLSPVWSPDGKRIAFCSSRSGHYDLYQMSTSGESAEELLYESHENKFPTSWSRDGKFLLYGMQGGDTKGDIWVLPLDGKGKSVPTALIRTRANEGSAEFSPDARWIAFVSDDSGTSEVYVQPFTPPSASGTSLGSVKTLVSRGGGTTPRWRADGQELFYRRLDGMIMSVAVTPGVEFQPGDPRPLVKTPSSSDWDAAGDGRRFLLAVPVGPAIPEPFTVVLDWRAGLKK